MYGDTGIAPCKFTDGFERWYQAVDVGLFALYGIDMGNWLLPGVTDGCPP